jgi:hypothetical protein
MQSLSVYTAAVGNARPTESPPPAAAAAAAAAAGRETATEWSMLLCAVHQVLLPSLITELALHSVSILYRAAPQHLAAKLTP